MSIKQGVTTLRAALYDRISIDREESISIESQVAALRDLCAGRGWSVADDAIFIDRGFSGKNTRRPGFQAMLSRVKRGEFVAVVVYKLDRISRSVSDLFSTVDEFDRYGTAFVASSQPFDTSTPVGKLLMTMLAGVAAFEREMIVERTRDSLANKAKEGKWAGGRAPYGYRLAPSDNGRRTSRGLSVEPSEAEWVKDVFRRHLGGESVRSITQRMIEKGAPLPRGTRASWTTHTTFSIIRNPVYAGVVRRVHRNAPDVFADGVHEAIITREEWNAAQERFVPGRRFRDHQKRSSLLPYSILRCQRCGGGCGQKNTTVKGKAYAYYRCQNADRERTCEALGMRAEVVDQFVLDRLAELTHDPHLLDEHIRVAGSQAFGERDKLRDERARLEREIAKQLRDRETLLGRLVDSTVSEEKVSNIVATVAPLQERLADHRRGPEPRQRHSAVLWGN